MKKIQILACVLLLLSSNSYCESKMNWNYESDMAYVLQKMTGFSGLGDVAIGNMRYLSSTTTFDNFSNFISKYEKFSGVIYYELNVNENHFLIAVFDSNNNEKFINVYDGKKRYWVSYEGYSFNCVNQPKLEENSIISDGYLSLRVDVELGFVRNRCINVLSKLKKLKLIDRFNFK